MLITLLLALPAMVALAAAGSDGPYGLSGTWQDWLLAVVATGVAGLELWRWAVHRPELVVDGFGLFWRQFAKDPVPWASIERVEMQSQGGQDCLVVTLRKTPHLPDPPLSPLRLLRGSGRGAFSINPELLDKNLDQIAREIERFHPVPIRWAP